ncbi:hypothetical protein [Pseudoduganella violacea]|uniref:Hemerythrin n=1 Tax=Pseudoduganella violacea TaxID=1715466 RepID=A0A7W5BEL3_9BURK|nr:hypothetical protein [Pseudoduganella violacea]MBB3121756.1 hemerythrin [Pseudoduganella violacea]
MFDTLARLMQLPDAQVAVELVELTEAIEFEFRMEDERMDAAGLSCLQSQREWHARVLGALHRALPPAAMGNVRDARRIAAALPIYLTDHFASIEAVLPIDPTGSPATRH